jgi:hypothetical protein
MRVGVVESHQLDDLGQPLQNLARIAPKAPPAGRPGGPTMHGGIAARLRGDATCQRTLDENIDFSRIFYLLHRVLRGLQISRVQPSRRIRNGQGAARRDFPSPCPLFGL